MQAFIIDTFSNGQFKGNPTAVCLIDKSIPSDRALSLARDFDVPVTAFIEYPKTGNIFFIRYFTGTKEIPACGHATLAAAHVADNIFSIANASFRTIENILIPTRKQDNVITMTYPKYGLISSPVPGLLLQSLHIDKYISSGFCPELETLFIELDSPDLLRSVQPDYTRLIASSDTIKEVVITSPSDDDKYDFILRSFCPWIGIDEDPVTGSVHSVLAGFWKARLGKTNLKAYQASSQGGEILVTAGPGEVQIGGTAITRTKRKFDSSLSRIPIFGENPACFGNSLE